MYNLKFVGSKFCSNLYLFVSVKNILLFIMMLKIKEYLLNFILFLFCYCLILVIVLLKVYGYFDEIII